MPRMIYGGGNSPRMEEYNPNIIKSKRQFVYQMISSVRNDGGIEFWVLNKKYLEIYHFKATQVSEFDVQIDLNNALEREHIFTGMFVLHMKENILEFLEEVPGTVYLKKIECYRSLYDSLYEKTSKTKTLRIKQELVDKIEFIEEEFPQLVI